MLCVSPIGLAFSDDPGRAFQIGAEAASLLDADFNSYLAAGVVALLFALMEQGASNREAIAETLAFIRPLDWPCDVSNTLRSILESEYPPGAHAHPACADLFSAVSAASQGSSLFRVGVTAETLRASSSAVTLAVQFECAASTFHGRGAM
ncbi:MAG: hypothetical protein BGO83_18880 [Devosia sp. 66-14]|nr:MAG: hypothetical protein ABS47_10270 [Devosia sp. SCN 66-27]OJX22838.1 MAG: hypothetical protein BGO83_18880 [Devosia sp. 66-14]